MKKIILLVMAMVLLISAALAENLTSLSDEELQKLYNQVSDELKRRNIDVTSEIPEDYSDSEVSERLYSFLQCWAASDYPHMLDYCTSEWKSKQEDPQTELFRIIANRTPLSYEKLDQSGSPEDAERTVSIALMLDKNNGHAPEKYFFKIAMKQEEDGLWYIDPTSLATDEIPEATLVPELTSSPEAGISGDTLTFYEPTPTPEAEITGDTLLYYNPEGGSKYHLDPNCLSVNPKFVPLQGSFRYSEVNDLQYQDLAPCRICGAPEKSGSTMLSPEEYTQKAWPFTAETYAEMLNNAEIGLNHPFCVKGMVREIISENPLTVVINTSEDGESQPVMIESPDADKIHWEKGCEYQIYGDFVSIKDNMPVLSARFSFTW